MSVVGQPEIRFLVNLRTETATAEFRDRVRPHGWLFPPAYSTAATLAYARDQARRGVPVLADNGLFDDLSRIAQDHEAAAAPVRAVLENLRDQVGGPPTRGEVPAPLRAAARDVATLVENETGPLRDSHATRSADLAAMGLTAFVGAEDPSPGVWGRLGIGPEGVGLLAQEWRSVASTVSRAAVQDRAATPAATGYLPVASPLDEASGSYFGDEFAKAQITEMAIGFGVLMVEQRFTNRVVINHRAVDLPRSLPSSYITAVVTLRAFLDAYTQRAGQPPQRLHLLGLGAPIMIALAARICRDVPMVTLDATSPIRDASFGTLYSTRPTLLRMNPTKVAAAVVADGRRTGWSCPCGSCRSFHDQFPQDADAARAAWARLGKPADLTLHLVEGEELGDALPLLSVNRTGSPRGPAARQTRLGHNHWSLTRLCADLTDHLGAGTIDTQVTEIVETYSQSAQPVYVDAVKWAHQHATAT